MNRRTDTKGFTLLELLVAAVIAVLLAGLVLVVTEGALRQWRRTQGGLTSAGQAELILNQIQRDLEAAGVNGNHCWLQVQLTDSTSSMAARGWVTTDARLRPVAESLRVSGGMDETDLVNARFGAGGAWMRMIATTAESTSEAEARPRGISWQIARRPGTGTVNPGNPSPIRYLLFRSAIGAADTFRLGYDVSASAYDSQSIAPGPTRAPATLTNPATVDAFAVNIVDFGCWLYRRDFSGQLRRIFPKNESDRAYRVDNDAAPEAAVIMVRILSEEGAEQLRAMEESSRSLAGESAEGESLWWSIVEAHSRVFVRWVDLPRRQP